jgi:phosphatidylglycerophosphate synthase
MSTFSTIDRRPMAARDHRLFVRSAAALARAGVTPNMVSVFGMLLGILGGLALAATSLELAELHRRLLFLTAAFLVPMRGVCNILDGVVAVNCELRTSSGELFNEVPDRVSDAAMLIGAGYAFGSSPTLGLLAVVLAIFVAYIRAAVKATGAAYDFCGPMSKPVRIFLITGACLWLAIAPQAGIMNLFLAVICVGCVFTAARRFRRALRTLDDNRGA